MHWRHVFGLSLCVSLSWGAFVQADLFDDARNSIRTNLYDDASGLSIRGGSNLSTGVAGNTTLFRTNATMGGTCGNFDFGASLKQAFEEIPGVLEAAGEAILQNLPMLALCTLEPSLCDIVKHFQALMNALIQARYAQCQSIQNAMAYSGLRLHGGAISQCLEEEAQAGSSISQALAHCNGNLDSIRLPSGLKGRQVNLIQDTLAAAGANQETQTLAGSLVGEVKIQAGGPLSAQNEKTPAAMLALYEKNRTAADSALRAALDEYQRTGALADNTIRSVSVPGQVFPRAAIEALALLQQDPARMEQLLGKLSTATALTQLTWQVVDLQNQLSAATEGNQHLTDEQRRLLEERYKALQVNLAQTMQKIEVLEKQFKPAVDELLSEYTRVQSMATQAGITAPTVHAPRMPYRTQQPAGYGR